MHVVIVFDLMVTVLGILRMWTRWKIVNSSRQRADQASSEDQRMCYTKEAIAVSSKKTAMVYKTLNYRLQNKESPNIGLCKRSILEF